MCCAGTFAACAPRTLGGGARHDLPLGRSVDEALRVIDALQHFEKHGEVCPADWKPGKDALNPKKANEYFEKVNK